MNSGTTWLIEFDCIWSNSTTTWVQISLDHFELPRQNEVSTYVILSTIEIEYVAVVKVGKEILLMKRLFQQLSLK